MVAPETRNERTIRRLFETVINGQQYEQIQEYCQQDVVLNRPGGRRVVGRDAYAQHYRELHGVFPDLATDLTDLVADRERVATRFLVTGTHEGELMGVSASGNSVEFAAQILFRLADGRVTEEFHQSDWQAVESQIRE